MLSKFVQESWVTCAQNDTEALQAWGLAVSLKERHTGKKLTVIVSPKVSAPISYENTWLNFNFADQPPKTVWVLISDSF